MKISFQEVVELYRLSGLPEINGSSFCYEGALTADLEAAVRRLESQGSQFAELVDSVEYTTPFRFEIMVVGDSRTQFCSTFPELIDQAKTLSKGVLLENVFIRDQDWSSYDETFSQAFENIKSACLLVRNLSNLSEMSDISSSPTYNTLHITMPERKGAPPTTFHLKTIITTDILDISLNHVNLVGLIKAQIDAGGVHADERAQIFWSAVSEVLEESHLDMSQPFVFLLKNWDSVLRVYRHNLQIYLKKFSFEKIKQELCQTTIEHSQKIGSAFGDIASKLLALPLSVVLLERLYESDSMTSKILCFAGLALTSTILASLIRNQQLSFERMRSSQKLMLSGLQSERNYFTREIREFMNISIEQTSDQETYISRIISLYKILSWIPIFFGLLFIFLIDSTDPTNTPNYLFDLLFQLWSSVKLMTSQFIAWTM